MYEIMYNTILSFEGKFVRNIRRKNMFTKYHFDKEQIKIRLRECRDGANPNNNKYTQLEFAQKIRNAQGLHINEDAGRSTVSTWEQANKSIPDIKDMLAICNVLEMDFDALIGRTTIDSKDINAVMTATGLDANALHALDANPDNAAFVNHLLKCDSFSEVVKCSNQLAMSSIMRDLIETAFSDSLIKLIENWFSEYYYSCFPMDMSIDSYADYIRNNCRISGEDLFQKHFLDEGQNYILNEHDNFSALSDSEKFSITTDTIAQISYDYLISTNVMALSRKRIIDMFADMLDDYIEKQSNNIHSRIKDNAANGLSSPKH